MKSLVYVLFSISQRVRNHIIKFIKEKLLTNAAPSVSIVKNTRRLKLPDVISLPKIHISNKVADFVSIPKIS